MFTAAYGEAHTVGGLNVEIPVLRRASFPRPFLKRSNSTEPRAFEELVSANLDALFRTAVRLCDGRAADAEDLLQDAMLRAFERYAELRDPTAGRAWLFTILVRTNLNRVRALRRRTEALTADLDDGAFEEALASWAPTPTPDEWLERAQAREHIARALDALEPELRAVVWLVDVEGFTQREAAAMLDVPEGTVASRQFRARRLLRDALRDALGGDGRTTRAGRTT